MSTCPTCQTTLRQFDYQQLTLCQCEACSGYWFREGQFRQAKALGFSGLPGTPSQQRAEGNAPSETSTGAESPALACPECGIPLMPYTYAYSSGIQLHRCAQCAGIWAAYDDLLHIERLLAGYQESLEDAKSKVMPLLMKVKRQVQEAEQIREADQRNNSFFRRVFRHRPVKSQPGQRLLDEIDAAASAAENTDDNE